MDAACSWPGPCSAVLTSLCARWQVADLRVALQRAEQQQARKEDYLREEISELQQVTGLRRPSPLPSASLAFSRPFDEKDGWSMVEMNCLIPLMLIVSSGCLFDWEKRLMKSKKKKICIKKTNS